MIARLVIDYSRRVLQEPKWQTAEGWQSVRSTIRTSIFSNRNCELSLHESGDLLPTYLDGDPPGVKKDLQMMLERRRKADLNQVSGWGGRGIRIQIEDWLSAEQSASLPETLKVRELRYRISCPGFRTQQITLVTTLVDAQRYPADESARVYFRRWRIGVSGEGHIIQSVKVRPRQPAPDYPVRRDRQSAVIRP